MYLVHLILKCSPPSRILANVFGWNNTTHAYGAWRAGLREKVAVWHREELTKLDPGFAAEERSRNLVHRQKAAERRGIGPMDPHYPSVDIDEALRAGRSHRENA